ncbi:MAG: VanZ family protein [Planctomycetota bacterium]|jgi:hypothetical protein
MLLSRRHKVTVILLLFYWPAIFILSHVPLTTVPPWVLKVGISDKVLHYLGYLVLVFLLWCAISPDRKVSWRKATVWWVLFVVVWYGVCDEWLQSYVGRSPNVMDFVADLAGALTALFILSIFTFLPAALIVTATVIFAVTNLSRVDIARVIPTISATFNLFAYSLFSILWVEYIHLFVELRPPKTKWLKIAFAVPIVLLLVVRSFSTILRKSFGLTDTVVAAIGIGVVVITYYLIAMLRDKVAKKIHNIQS